MPVEATCPKCLTRLRGPENAPGRMVECPRCRQVFRFPRRDSPAASAVEAVAEQSFNVRACPVCGAQVRTTARTCGACGTTLAPQPTDAFPPGRTVTTPNDDTLVASAAPVSTGRTTPARRRIVLYGLPLTAVMAVVGGFALSHFRSAELAAIVDRCPSSRGVDLRVSYDGLFAKDVVICDLRGVRGDDVRRVDLIHLFLQFGHRLDTTSVRAVILARDGRPIFRISSAELRELTDEYTYGNPLWSINNLPSRVRRPDGTRPFSLPEGGWLYVLKEQTEQVNRFIADWSGF